MTERLDAVHEQLADLREKLERLAMLTEILSESANDAMNVLEDAQQNVKVLSKDGD